MKYYQGKPINEEEQPEPIEDNQYKDSLIQPGKFDVVDLAACLYLLLFCVLISGYWIYFKCCFMREYRQEEMSRRTSQPDIEIPAQAKTDE